MDRTQVVHRIVARTLRVFLLTCRRRDRLNAAYEAHPSPRNEARSEAGWDDWQVAYDRYMSALHRRRPFKQVSRVVGSPP